MDGMDVPDLFKFFEEKIRPSLSLSLPLQEANRLVLNHYFTSPTPPPYKYLLLCPIIIDTIGFIAMRLLPSVCMALLPLLLIFSCVWRSAHDFFCSVIDGKIYNKGDELPCFIWPVACSLPLWWLDDHLDPTSLFFLYIPLFQLIDCFNIYRYMSRTFKSELFVVKDGSRRLVFLVIGNAEGQSMGFSHVFHGFHGPFLNTQAASEAHMVMKNELMSNLLHGLQVEHPHLRMRDIIPRPQIVFNSVTQARRARPLLNAHLIHI